MKFDMKTVQGFAVTTAGVLAIIWLVRRTAVGKTIVTKALAG